MLETISIIVGVATSILSAIGHIKSVSAEKKIQISSLFISIADTLDRCVTEFKNNQIPHGACDELRRYALELPKVLGDVISEEKTNQYSNDLFQAYNVESLLMVTQQHPEQLIELEKAASAFRVASNVVKLSK